MEIFFSVYCIEMYQHQDWTVVTFKNNNYKQTTNLQTETQVRHKPTCTVVSTKKLDENKEDFHHKRISKDVANEIIKKRVERRMTQAELAKQINELPSVIQEIENGKAIYNHIVMNKINRVLGLQRKNKI